MTTKTHRIDVSGLSVEVVRKDIKNLHLGVYPPDGRVRVAAPTAVSDDAVRLAVVRKLAWIRRQQAKFEAQQRQSDREMVSGESHFFLGRRYRLRVTEGKGPCSVQVSSGGYMDMHVRPGTSPDRRRLLLQEWYRKQLRELIPPLIDKWEPVLGVHVADWGIKRMKTKWGSCNVTAGRIWLNLELAKKPVECLEYVVVHEMAHLLERHHNGRFISFMDDHLPQWRTHRDELNAAPLAHECWDR